MGHQTGLDRRQLLKAAGALIISAGVPLPSDAALPNLRPGKPALHPTELDTWLAIATDGRVTAFFGKMDMGQGVDVAIAQIVAEELDVALDRVEVVMGDTALTVNQGGASGSTGIQRGGIPLRNAAAEARRLLLDMALKRLEAPVDRLQVEKGVVSVKDTPAKRVSYGDLVGGRAFDAKLSWNERYGNELVATGTAKPKDVSQYRIVGTSPPRRDVKPKVTGTLAFVTDVKVEGMLHARVLRPPVAGASPKSVDPASLSAIKGARAVIVQDLVAIVAESEWDAVRAAEAAKVTWSDAAPPFPAQDKLYDHIRAAKPMQREVPVNDGALDDGFAKAARVIEAEYEWPFQSHACMGPACALVDARADHATVWTGSQKPHYVRDGVARILGLKPEQVHGIWVPGPGSYGRNDAGDAAMEAAILSKATGRPVRVQGMRADGHGWDPKAPASIHRARAALAADGTVLAYHFESKGFSRLDVNSNESAPGDTLAGQLTGHAPKPQPAFGVPAESYGFAAKRLAWETIAPLLDRASPLRTAHLRDPVGPQIQFASESFIDEIAAATGADPVEFRLRHVKNPRDAAVIKAAAERFGWEARPSPKRERSGDVLVGRGIAYAQRSGCIVAIVAEIEVDRRSGRIRPRRFAVGHDCGLIVNPVTLRRVVEGNVIQAISRTLYEEVSFDARGVTSLDWLDYRILEIEDVPDAIDVVLIDRPNVAPAGAGEGSTRPVAGALANALFDATGVRIRRAPLSPARVKAALASVG
jgi:CO/xanthine dehydrogenase Mo-binding subunit